MQVEFQSRSNHVPLVKFSFATLCLVFNAYSDSLPQMKIWMKFYAYSIFIFNSILFTSKKIRTNSNVVQVCKLFGYRFFKHLPTFVGFYFRTCTPSSKQKILMCSPLTFWSQTQALRGYGLFLFVQWAIFKTWQKIIVFLNTHSLIIFLSARRWTVFPLYCTDRGFMPPEILLLQKNCVCDGDRV